MEGSTGHRYTLGKEERLSCKNDLDRLFSEGRYGTARNLRYCYRCGNGLSFNRIVVSVPKKCFKRAVKRNLLKRRIREAYRLNKYRLEASKEGGTDMLYIYRTKEAAAFADIQSDIISILENIGAAQKSATNSKADGDAAEIKVTGNVVDTATTTDNIFGDSAEDGKK